MRRLPGQAARIAAKVLHRAFALLLVLALGATLLLAGLAWRLSQGPVDLPWLAQRLEAAANAEAGGVRVAIGNAALTWQGFSLGVDRPLDIRLSDVSATDPAQGLSVVLPRVDVSLALGGLLLGRIQPRALEIDAVRLVMRRTQTGEVRLDFGGAEESVEGGNAAHSGPSAFAGLIAELARPPAVGNYARLERFSQLRRVRIRDATLILIDRQLAVLWRAQVPEIDLRRQAQGGVAGSGSIHLAMGAERASVDLRGTLAGDGSIRLSAWLADLAPAALARQIGDPRHPGALALLEALDARLAGTLDLEIGPDQALRRFALDLQAGPGQVTVGPSVVRLAGAELSLEGTDRDLLLKAFDLRLLAQEGGPVSTIGVTGTLHRPAGAGDGGRVTSDLSVTIDRVAFADLGQLWPVPLAPPPRAWITQNITAGVARDGQARVSLEANEDFSGLTVKAATGSLLGEGLTVHWLAPVAPIERGNARVNLLDVDNLEILVSSGRQTLDPGPHESGLVVRSGKVRIAGLSQAHQVATIEADIAGPVADAVTLLRSKSLHLFDRVQLDLNNPGGQLSGTIAATVKLEASLPIEQVPIRAKLRLQDAQFAGLVAGRDLRQGNIDIVATTEGLKLTGQAEIATIPTQIEAEMNFRSGPPSQMLRRIVASGRATSRQLAEIGLDAGQALGGSLALKAVVSERRDGSGEILVDADLAQATLLVAPIDWQKPAGQAASGQARLKLRRGRLVGIDDITLDGRAPGAEALSLRARAAFAEGRIAALTIDRVTLGRTSGAGTVRFPAGGGPIQAVFNGPVLDLSRVLSSKAGFGGRLPAEEAKLGPVWILDTRFDRAIMANGAIVGGLVAHAEHDGRVMRVLHVEAQTGAQAGDQAGPRREAGPAARFRLDIAAASGAGPRTLSANADDAGALLRAMDVVRTMQGGRLTMSGVYDDNAADHPLSGTAEITEFRIQDAPALGRLLQAMTLYGLVEVMQGPGLGFSRLVAPFRLTREALTLTDARAFSPSLGLTVKGRIDLVQDRLDLEGTIVPAYFFNSLLGNLPLVGRIFSPEAGGGLFAAGYSIRGTVNDPKVSVNPLSALTPGFLRGLFGIF